MSYADRPCSIIRCKYLIEAINYVLSCLKFGVDKNISENKKF